MTLDDMLSELHALRSVAPGSTRILLDDDCDPFPILGIDCIRMTHEANSVCVNCGTSMTDASAYDGPPGMSVLCRSCYVKLQSKKQAEQDQEVWYREMSQDD